MRRACLCARAAVGNVDACVHLRHCRPQLCHHGQGQLGNTKLLPNRVSAKSRAGARGRTKHLRPLPACCGAVRGGWGQWERREQQVAERLEKHHSNRVPAQRLPQPRPVNTFLLSLGVPAAAPLRHGPTAVLLVRLWPRPQQARQLRHLVMICGADACVEIPVWLQCALRLEGPSSTPLRYTRCNSVVGKVKNERGGGGARAVASVACGLCCEDLMTHHL